MFKYATELNTQWDMNTIGSYLVDFFFLNHFVNENFHSKIRKHKNVILEEFCTHTCMLAFKDIA